MKSYKMFITAIIIMTAATAHADMYSALDTVYHSNPVISQARAAVNVARADVSLAKTGMQPYLGVGGNISAARTKIASETFDYNPTQIGVEFQQNIFQGFSNITKIKAAKGILAAEMAALYATEQDVFLAAINAYIGVLRADEVLKLNQNNLRVLQEYYDYCQDLENVGKLTKTDVAQASARLEMAKYSLADAQAKYDNSLETFRRLYGGTMDEYTEINMTRVRHLFPASIFDAEECAIKHHPALLALHARESAAKENITIARKTMLPSVDVRAASFQVNDLPYIDKVRDSRVGVYLSMPLYDRGTAFANTEKVRHTVDGIQDEIINVRRTITEKLRQSWNMYESQESAISAAHAGIKANQMALAGTRAEQKNGRRTVLDVLNAEQELLNTQVSLAQAKYAQMSAFFAVLSAMGNLSAQNLGLTE